MTPDLMSSILFYLSLLFSLCVHEAAHAAMGTWCGDDTARLQGRLTLNPLAHIDLLGTVILPGFLILSGSGFLFGWAKPVPFNPSRLNNIRRDPVLIAIAGPASNLLLAFLFISVTRLLSITIGLGSLPSGLLEFLFMTILLNFILVVFNLIPVPPLDGHYVLDYFLPPGGQRILRQIGPFGIIIAIIVARPLFGVVVPVLREFIYVAIGL